MVQAINIKAGLARDSPGRKFIPPRLPLEKSFSSRELNMKPRHDYSCILLPVLSLFIIFLSAGLGRGQNPPPVKPNPRAPSLGVVVPVGVQRGTAIDLTLTGTNLAEPTGLWTSFPGKVIIPTDQNNGKDETKL